MPRDDKFSKYRRRFSVTLQDNSKRAQLIQKPVLAWEAPNKQGTQG